MEVVVRSIPIYYEEYGTGIPLLVLPGWAVDHTVMVPGIEPFFQTRPGWRRIYPDLPGTGKTPGAEWLKSNDLMLEVITEFMQIVAPDQHFVVAGTSYGGYLALGLVYKLGSLIDGIFLTVPHVEPDPAKQQLPLFKVIHEDAQFVAALNPEESWLINAAVIQSLDTLEITRTLVLPAIAAADHVFLNKLNEHYAFSFRVANLPVPFMAPTLILTGRQDTNCGYRGAYALLDHYPRATFAVLDRAGHALGLEQRGLLEFFTNEWINRVDEYLAK
jgi:pimeloyl-ACP methyl ester carboxylesterase